ncbi:recombination protein NinB [Chitinimonas sp.]|uniref:recombination protein NinB n=1 Tax=Chitinimonas sp. TaxID=1934313 RepID=UPI0035B21B83
MAEKQLNQTFVLTDDHAAGRLWAFLRNNWKPMAEQGKPLAVIVSQHKTKRTIEQNKRMWTLLHEIEEAAWLNGRQYSAAAWNEYFAGLFIGYEELPDGRQKAISTTTLSVPEMADHQTRIEAYAASELGIHFTF